MKWGRGWPWPRPHTYEHHLKLETTPSGSIRASSKTGDYYTSVSINQSNRSSTHTVVEHGSRGINLARLVVDANTMSDNFTALHDSIIMLTLRTSNYSDSKRCLL
jgi:hypothetical protein